MSMKLARREEPHSFEFSNRSVNVSTRFPTNLIWTTAIRASAIDEERHHALQSVHGGRFAAPQGEGGSRSRGVSQRHPHRPPYSHSIVN
jgi:hypothetical protein